MRLKSRSQGFEGAVLKPQAKMRARLTPGKDVLPARYSSGLSLANKRNRH
jgi:hypothetical protein